MPSDHPLLRALAALAPVLTAACDTPAAEVPTATKDGCSPLLAENVAAPDELMITEGQLFYTDQTSTLFRASPCAGQATRVNGSSVATLGATALSGGWVLESNETGVGLRPLAGDPWVPLAGGPTTHVLLAVNQEFAVWVQPQSADPTPIWAAARGGGAPWKVTEARPIVTALTMDADALYFATADAVMRSGLGNASQQELIARPGGVSALAVDDQSLYIAFRSGGFKQGGAITKLPKAGGLLLTLASESDEIVDAEKVGDSIVYVTRSAKGVGSVHEVPARGGIGKKLGPAKDACGITADDKAVFVASCAQGRGTITRLHR